MASGGMKPLRFGLIESAGGRYGIDLNLGGPGLVKTLDEIKSDDGDDDGMEEDDAEEARSS